jgi:O-antigen biosynthesis protein WbqV
MEKKSKAVWPRLMQVWGTKLVLHAALLFAALIIAYELRRGMSLHWWLANPDSGRVVGWAALYALTGVMVEAVFQSERSVWRFFSLRDLLGLFRNVTLTIGLFLATVFVVDRGVLLPRSVPFITWLMSIALLGGLRVAWRVHHDRALALHFLPAWWPKRVEGGIPLWVVGSMAEADSHLRMMLGDPHRIYRVIGIVTPNAHEVGLRLHGVPFLARIADWRPTSQVPDRSQAAIVFLDDPIKAYGFTTERIGELRRAGYTLLKPHALGEMDGPSKGMKEIPFEDFLPRKPVNLDPAPVRALIAGKRVLVTGAGGSIGSEICRQLVSLGCAELCMLDHSEYHLFEIDREIGSSQPSLRRRAVLANVRDADRLSEIINQHRPEILFHAAALKHVGLVEQNPSEGILTNVLGTLNVAKAAAGGGVGQFVLISTDKAVAPTNVMGASKRIAECVLEMVPRTHTRMIAVRFGNVLGSAGSVVPIFQSQIAAGGPVTVTHPEVSRYFMTIPEAVQLVLHSTALSAGAEYSRPRKFLLEMGDPVRISDLARQMIELSGKSPDDEVEIRYIGLKPGEKLAETLSDDGEEVSPCVDGIVEVKSLPTTKVREKELQYLIERARTGDDKSVSEIAFRILSERLGLDS